MLISQLLPQYHHLSEMLAMYMLTLTDNAFTIISPKI